ncbi:hypothetical protein [Entomospira culicis]|uniref:Uncharacterized protein n=1 Tax=Entomospira culicis TaxID=2719989 RepID=A0A968GFV3_9SPIO|nr:hypothetical protein [Entomospira culicis]NIZ19558.1 hypothetical protein [Entomospira culicis]NIZ69537.1 hypothetical protein [Entomospira culicis]WDI36649.1 hypothetical protein PVA46_04810 [Entomospira culicis]WDI38278.1 hypothetical protein PVA47_04820 [Entomospira culicis]
MNIISFLSDKSNAKEKSFAKNLERKAQAFLALLHFCNEHILEPELFSRSLLNQLQIKSSELEEFLDVAGALSNKYWYPFRKSVAMVKIFSMVHYKFIHIADSLERYKLPQVDGDFPTDIKRILTLTLATLQESVQFSLLEAKRADIHLESEAVIDSFETDIPYQHLLPATRITRHDTQPGITVVKLATEFLTLSGGNRIFETASDLAQDEPLEKFIPHPLNAEDLRWLETRFHNLQSFYDTYVLGSDLTQQDKNIPALRGLISLIFHLLITLTQCIHYYQRHYTTVTQERKLRFFRSKNHSYRHLPEIIKFSLIYADRYRKAGRHLSHQMLRQYAEHGTIEVPVPSYRGFHVRPSTLISKIVLHYGSEVSMKLYDQLYNAALPLELFRANETINALKRTSIFEILESSEAYNRYIERFGSSCDFFFRYLGSDLQSERESQFFTLRDKVQEIAADVAAEMREMPSTLNDAQPLYFKLLRSVGKDILFELLEKKKIVAYDPFFNFDGTRDEAGETLLEFMRRALTRYMALGKMDCSIDTMVVFEGDTRVLSDIKILAYNGYGEDRFGNNIMLPTELSYLSH